MGGAVGSLVGGAAGFLVGGPVGAAIGAGIGSGVDQSRAAGQAASAQQAAASQATAAQQQIADQQVALQREIFNRQVALQEPFRQAGLAGQNRLLELLGVGGTRTAPGYGRYATAEFTPAQFLANQDPGYAFRMSEGMKALERSAASRGGLLSGATMRGIQRYGQDLASQEYQNAFNRYQAQRTGTLNPLQSLSGVAQSSANTLGQAAGQMGGNIQSALGALGAGQAANIIGAGNAQASGYIGQANALASGLGQGLNFYSQQQLLNRLLPGGGIGGGAGAPVFDYSTPYMG
jgi:hypothetical protein